MGADLCQLAGVQPTRLLQDGVGHADLADVVHPARHLDALDALWRERDR
jgi:hypothetical protein